MSSKYYSLLIILLFFLNIENSFNKNLQKSIKLIHADFIQKEDHDDTVFLIGHVHIKHKEYQLFCDKAIYKKKNKFYGYGNVQLKSEKNKIFSQKIEFSENMNNLKASGKVILVQKNIKLTANIINYNFRKKFFQAIQNVVLLLDELKLYTNILEYDLNFNKIFYKRGSTLFYKDYNIYSKEGSYFPLKKKATLKYEVKLISKNYTVYSNSIEYLFSIDKIKFYSPTIVINNNKIENFFYAKSGYFFIKKNIFLSKEYCSLHYNDKIIKGKYWFFDYNKKSGFIKNIFFEDKKKGYFFIGDNGNFDLYSGLIFLKKNIVFIKIKPKEDSFFIYSDKIKINLKNESILSIQFFPVIGFFLNEELQIKSYSLIYEPSNKSIQFNGNPIFWIKNQQITGDSIFIHFKNDFFLDYLKIMKNAFYIKKINSKEFNQIKGEIMIGLFDKKNVLKKILIKGNAKSIIFHYNNSSLYNKKKIINKSSCGIIYANLEKGKKIKKIFFLEKSNSELFLLSNSIFEKNLFLPQFSWKEKEKSKNKKYLIYEKIKKYRKESLEEKKEIEKLIKKNNMYE
ncbi:hypothetical protein DM811_02985 [Blattabacterium punctulatus]|uniref:OstA-like protein n=1 Tax=Blattabacterium punctulatus TaxID=164514 RepID=UPI000D7D1FC7|nr:OstA-like protein [Blattabacterium punctulatus]AWU42888.1 hypothetical protein DM811_02985 [Blattabacterium punctulatus]